jgi:hypothetical protein
MAPRGLPVRARLSDVPDFDHLYAAEAAAVARRVEQIAATVRERAGILAAAGERCAWDGAGAWAFRSSAARTVARLRRGAGHLDAAAEALRRHGARVGAAVEARDAQRLRDAQHLLHEVQDALHHLGARP